jgi:hypothetical protein
MNLADLGWKAKKPASWQASKLVSQQAMMRLFGLYF